MSSLWVDLSQRVRRLRSVAFGVVAVSLCLSFGMPRDEAHAGDNTLPANPAEALAAALPFIEAARSAKSAETPELVTGIRRAVDLMQPHTKAGTEDPAWAALWNEALTLSRFHGNSPTGLYALASHEVLTDYVSVGLPVRKGWAFRSGTAGTRAQSFGEITRTTSEGGISCVVRMSSYYFNYTYSGVGGENSAALADYFFSDYREQMKPIESRSPKVLAKPLSKSFPRSSYFEIIGTFEKEGRARVRSYFVKNSTMTIQIEAIEYRAAKLTETPAETWQRTVSDPELDAMLASFEAVDPKKRKK